MWTAVVPTEVQLETKFQRVNHVELEAALPVQENVERQNEKKRDKLLHGKVRLLAANSRKKKISHDYTKIQQKVVSGERDRHSRRVLKLDEPLNGSCRPAQKCPGSLRFTVVYLPPRPSSKNRRRRATIKTNLGAVNRIQTAEERSRYKYNSPIPALADYVVPGNLIHIQGDRGIKHDR